MTAVPLPTSLLDFAQLWGCFSPPRVPKLGVNIYSLINFDKMAKSQTFPKELIWSSLFPMLSKAYRRNDRWIADAIKARMFGSEVFSIAFDGVTPVSIAAVDTLRFNGYRIAYFAMTGTDVEYQGSGIASEMKRILTSNCHFVVGRTQNPVVLKTTAKIYGKLAPVDGITQEELLLLKEVARSHGCDMDEQCVCRGIYEGRPLYDEPFDTGDRFSEFLVGVLNAQAGDALMFIARNENAFFKAK